MMWLRNVVCLTALAVMSSGANASGAEIGKMPQVLIKIRFLQGDRDNPRELKTLAAPSVLTTSGQQASVVIGQEHLHDASGMRIVSGIDLRVKPTVRDDGRMSVELEFNVTQPVKKVDDGVAVKGTCIRSNLLVTPGKCHQIGGLKSSDADETWLELTAELAAPEGAAAPQP